MATTHELAELSKCLCFDRGVLDRAKTALMLRFAGLDDPSIKVYVANISSFVYTEIPGVDTVYSRAATLTSGTLSNADNLEYFRSWATSIGTLQLDNDESLLGVYGQYATSANTISITNSTTQVGLPTAYFEFPSLITADTIVIWNNHDMHTIDLSSLQTVTGNLNLANNRDGTYVKLDSLVSVGGFLDLYFFGLFAETMSLPELVSVGGYFFCTGSIAKGDEVTTFSAPKLQTVGSAILCSDWTKLTSVSFPSLVSVGNEFRFKDGPLLTSLSIPVFVPYSGQTLNFSGLALDDTSVNHVLARCVANPSYNSGLVNLSGGTSAAPTGQGIVDAATLDGRGVSVAVNP